MLGGGEVRGRADPVLVEGGEQAPCAEERRKVVLHVGQVDFSFFFFSVWCRWRAQCPDALLMSDGQALAASFTIYIYIYIYYSI